MLHGFAAAVIPLHTALLSILIIVFGPGIGGGGVHALICAHCAGVTAIDDSLSFPIDCPRLTTKTDVYTNVCGAGMICTRLNGTVAKLLLDPVEYNAGNEYYTCGCKAGLFGPQCESVCPTGFWGPDCANRCDCKLPNSPSQQACEPINGICLCAPGWSRWLYPENPLEMPDRQCVHKCPEGTYGLKCQQACNCQNNGTCHHANGQCKCSNEWTGPTCEERCDSILKSGCSFACQCVNGQGACNTSIGECVCEPGFMGPRCQWPCPTGFWGAGCFNQCKCENAGLCNRLDGTCACPRGYGGKHCKSKENAGGGGGGEGAVHVLHEDDQNVLLHFDGKNTNNNGIEQPATEEEPTVSAPAYAEKVDQQQQLEGAR